MYGNQSKHDLIRLGTVYVVLRFEDVFREVILKAEGYNSDLNYEKFVSKTIKLGKWGDEYVLLALSVLLNRSVYCYSIDPSTYIANSIKYTASLEQNKNYPLAIALYGNHFIPLLPKDGSIVPPKPLRSNFGIIFRKI